MVFCNKSDSIAVYDTDIVTILILIDGFLQYDESYFDDDDKIGHNPYFNRWFSAMTEGVI